jgi:hypothetical protein
MHRRSTLAILAVVAVAIPLLVAATSPNTQQPGTPGYTTGLVLRMDVDIGSSNQRSVTFTIDPASDKDRAHGTAVTFCDGFTGKMRDMPGTDIALVALHLAIGTAKTATVNYVQWGNMKCITNVHITAP